MTNTIKLLNKYIFILLTLVFVITAAHMTSRVVQKAHAQSPTTGTSTSTTSKSPSAACATTVWMCPNITDLDAGRLGAHRLRLQASNIPTINPINGQPVDVHIVCGFSTPDGDLFSTGNAATDKSLCIGDGTLSKMQSSQYRYAV